jgi:uncharacterized membrane protein
MNTHAPQAALDDVSATNDANRGSNNDPAAETLIPGGRACPAGSGWRWIVQGWQLFKMTPFMFLAALLIAICLYLIIALIPLLNLLISLVAPFFIAGFGACARSVAKEGHFGLGQLFDGLRNRPGALMLVGLIYLASAVAVFIAAAVIFRSSGLFTLATGGQLAPNTVFFPSLLGALLFIFAGLTLVLAAFVYAPFLVHEHAHLSAFKAMKMSFQGCFRNFTAGTVFCLIVMVLGVLASLPFGLGWLILLPVVQLATYASYHDIYIATEG